MSGEGGIYVSDAEFASWQREAQEERRNGRQPPPTRRLTLTASSGITSGRVHWLWEDWIPLRSVAVVAGEPGLGKSILTGACLPSAVTRGTLEGELRGQPADVAIVSAEDDWSTVIVPRLMAAGADLKR